MTMPNDPNAKGITPDQLANQLFDAAFMQNTKDPREAARTVIVFLTEAIIYAVSNTAGDEAARKGLLKSVGDTITNAQPSPKKP